MKLFKHRVSNKYDHEICGWIGKLSYYFRYFYGDGKGFRIRIPFEVSYNWGIQRLDLYKDKNDPRWSTPGIWKQHGWKFYIPIPFITRVDCPDY